MILTYDKDGEPHTYLAKGVPGQVNGSVYTYVYTEQYDLTADFGAKTFSFTPDTYKRSFRAYDYTYLYLLANGYQLESQYGVMQIVENVEGGVSNYTISGAFKYFPELDAEGKPVKRIIRPSSATLRLRTASCPKQDTQTADTVTLTLPSSWLTEKRIT